MEEDGAAVCLGRWAAGGVRGAGQYSIPSIVFQVIPGESGRDGYKRKGKNSK